MFRRIKKKIKAKILRFLRRVSVRSMQDVSTGITQKTAIQANTHANRVIRAQAVGILKPYRSGEPIRILFLFQAASFWPSWESFYESCMQDERFEVTFAFLNETNKEVSQMLTAESFLKEKQIPYVYYSDELLMRTNPHVLVLQTPYDWQRLAHAKSSVLVKYGARLVYITYGIEIADTDHAHSDHFKTGVLNCWRVYTFSERMRMDYLIHCSNGGAVRSVGHPKFDGLYHRERFSLPQEVQERKGDRKVFLWHTHFPKLVRQSHASPKLSTPYLSEYIAFAEYAKSHPEDFFIFQPHPKYLDCEKPLRQQAQKLFETVRDAENVYIDRSDDYRACLLNADYIMTDRSAIMIEGAVTGVPILYLSNADYNEPMTQAVLPLVESYAQGHTCKDMIAFVERCGQGLDPEKEQREAAFRQCIPYFDGKCGERIKEDIAASILSPEQKMLFDLQKQVAELSQAVRELQKK